MAARTPRAVAFALCAALVLVAQCHSTDGWLGVPAPGAAVAPAPVVRRMAGATVTARVSASSVASDADPHVVYLVLGAGAAVVNGKFLQQDDLRNGAHQFVMLGDTPPNGGAGTGPSGSPVVMYSQLAFRNTMRLWFLGVEDTGGHIHEYYWVTNEPSAMYPPASGWQVEATIGQQPPPNVTPMHGQCYTNGTCVCNTGYFGPNCQQQCNATLMCSGHGQCKNDMCSCDAGFAGPSCLECGPVLLGPPVTTVPHGIWDDGKCQCLSGYAGDMCGEKTAKPRWMFWTWFTLMDYLVIGGALVGMVLLCLLTCYCCNRCKDAQFASDEEETRRLLSSKRNKRLSGTRGSGAGASFGGGGPTIGTTVTAAPSMIHGSGGKLYGSGKGSGMLHGSGSGRWTTSRADASALSPRKASPSSPHRRGMVSGDAVLATSGGAGHTPGGRGGDGGSKGAPLGPVLGFGESVRVAYNYHRAPVGGGSLAHPPAPSPSHSSSRRRGRARAPAHDAAARAPPTGVVGADAISPRSRRSSSGARTAATPDGRLSSTARIRAAIRAPAMPPGHGESPSAWSSGGMHSGTGGSGAGGVAGALHRSSGRGRTVGAHAIIASVAGGGGGLAPVKHVSGASLHASSSTG